MPSLLHEVLLELFRNCPTLASDLLRDALNVTLPPHTAASIDSENLTQVQPAEYRADLVICLNDDRTVLGIIVEVQLSPNPDKPYAWPAYVTTLRARLRRPVVLMVVAPDEPTARWARRSVELGDGNLFTPLVIGPGSVPIVTDEERARADPELAVLSALVHGRHADAGLAARIAAAAQLASRDLEDGRATLYYDLSQMTLSEGARKVLKHMTIANYEYQSEFARRYFAQGMAEGRTEGKTEGKADLLVRQLTRRFGSLPDAAAKQLAQASITELDDIGERLLTAGSLDEALGR